MGEERSGFQRGLYIALLAVFLGGFLASGLLGPALVAFLSLGAALVATGWYAWPKLRRLRLRSPVYTPSPVDASSAQTDDDRRQSLKNLLMFLAQRGDALAHAPLYIWRRWEGAVTDVLQDALGNDVVDSVVGFPQSQQQVEALRVVIRSLDTLEISPAFDPRSFQNLSV